MLKKNMPELGAYAPQPFEDFRPVNWKNALSVCVVTLFSSSLVMFFFCEAETIKELSLSAYVSSAVFTLTLMLANIIVKTVPIFKLIERFESIVEERKLRKFSCSEF